MDRSNPYENAFEAYLKAKGLCYVAVDETRRACLGETPVKNLDFIVLAQTGAKLLVDVKGRQFPGGRAEKPRYVWESWATQEDVTGLESWTSLFGATSLALFVFLYRIGSAVALPDDTPDLWHFRDETYLVRAVTLDDYRKQMKVRSPKWGTVALSGPIFKTLARPFRYYSHECPVAVEVSDHAEDPARRLAEVVQLAFAQSAARGAAAGSAWR